MFFRAWALAAAAAFLGTPQRGDRRNVLLLMADDLRPELAGCGSSWIRELSTFATFGRALV